VGKIIENLDIVTKLKDFGSIFQDYCFVYAKKKKIVSVVTKFKFFICFSQPMLSLRENQGK
jgi:hypothetical protein